MSEKTKELKYKFTNQIMFAIIMRDEELCSELIQRIIPERRIRKIRFPDSPVVNLKYLETEKTLIPGLYAKSVRLDVLFEDSDIWCVIEMQVQNTGELPPRIRYYHSVLDAYFLKRGQNYDALKPCYVIFICMFDLFEMGEPVYRFQMLDEKNHLPLGDEQYTLILNADCSPENYPEQLRTFFAYLKDGTVEESDALIQEIHHRVEHANQVEGVQELMTVQEELELRERRLKAAERVIAEAEAQAAEAEAKAQEAEAQAAEAEAKAQEAEAKAQEAEAVNLLMVLLLKDGRIDELKQSTEDEVLRDKLMKEYKVR